MANPVLEITLRDQLTLTGQPTPSLNVGGISGVQIVIPKAFIRPYFWGSSYTPGSTSIAGWKMDGLKMYLLLKMGIFQPAL